MWLLAMFCAGCICITRFALSVDVEWDSDGGIGQTLALWFWNHTWTTRTLRPVSAAKVSLTCKLWKTDRQSVTMLSPLWLVLLMLLSYNCTEPHTTVQVHTGCLWVKNGQTARWVHRVTYDLIYAHFFLKAQSGWQFVITYTTQKKGE